MCHRTQRNQSDTDLGASSLLHNSYSAARYYPYYQRKKVITDLNQLSIRLGTVTISLIRYAHCSKGIIDIMGVTDNFRVDLIGHKTNHDRGKESLTR